MEKGIYTALVTPFKSSGEVDAEKTEFFIERQIKGGVKGVVLVGTTGEAPTLSREEKATWARIFCCPSRPITTSPTTRECITILLPLQTRLRRPYCFTTCRPAREAVFRCLCSDG